MRIVFATFGFLFLALGAVGIALPVLPTTPFIMASAFCFAKSSEKLNDWFLSTNLYRKYLDSFVAGKTMTIRAKATVLSCVTALMSICFFLAGNAPAVRVVIVIVWCCHVIYFLFYIRTASEREKR